jgi:AcrR family transcriptional regulator
VSELKEKILVSAYQHYIDHGYDGVTLRSIAKELGVTHPAVYTYFSSKDDLFSSLKLQAWRSLKEKLFTGINPHGTFKQIMQQICENFVDFFDDNRAYFSMLFLQSGLDNNSREAQLQILEYIDQLLLLPEHNINLPQIFWYSLIGHGYAWFSGEITKQKLFELINDTIDRLGRSQ